MKGEKVTPKIDYLEELEKAKKQYEKYLEINDIRKLLEKSPEVPPQREPSIENPLTTHTIGQIQG